MNMAGSCGEALLRNPTVTSITRVASRMGAAICTPISHMPPAARSSSRAAA